MSGEFLVNSDEYSVTASFREKDHHTGTTAFIGSITAVGSKTMNNNERCWDGIC